jgi:hypothetical protein
MKKLAVLFGIVAVVLVGYLALTTVAPTTTMSTAVAAGPTYSATVYVAGHGGHFAQADVIIDPSNANEPVKITKLDKVDIGDSKSHATHDARIDSNDPNVLFWSTYIPDTNKKMHVGKSDLKTGKVIQDVTLTPDAARAPGEKAPLYCASGQSKDNYMPVFMGVEGYVDVFSKKDLTLKHRVFISDMGYAKGTYKFTHGTNSNDMKTWIFTMNQVKDGKATGDVDFVLVDLPALENGKLKVIAKNTIKGDPNNTITFRMYFTKDDKFIMQSAADRLWVLDAKTLKLVDEKMMPAAHQLHDAMPTPDGKFALMTVRNVAEGCDVEGKGIKDDKGEAKTITDGVFMLYDAGAKMVSAKTMSTCFNCHKSMGKGDKNAVLCGLAANFKK